MRVDQQEQNLLDQLEMMHLLDLHLPTILHHSKVLLLHLQEVVEARKAQVAVVAVAVEDQEEANLN